MLQNKPTRTRKKTNYKNAEKEVKEKLVDIVPYNDNQRLYLDSLNNNKQVIALGPSGTGKSWMAATYASNQLLLKNVDKIIVTRPAVSVGKTLGALPGTMEEKFSPWLSPILSVIEEHLDKNTFDSKIKNGNIQMAPLEYMRGSSFHDAIVLLDEAQNLTVSQFKMVVTRVGENCKLIMNGDIRQSDINEQSGLSKAIYLAKKYNIDAAVVEFTLEDVVRSDICKQWLEAFYAENL